MAKKNRYKQITPENSNGEATYVMEETDDAVQTSEENVAAVEQLISTEPLVEFDGWYASRSSKIPAHHHKEIIQADFKARKTPMRATMAVFDAALKKYGIKLV